MSRAIGLAASAAVIAAFMVLPGSALAAGPGELDSSFSRDGFTCIDFGRADTAEGVFADASGRVTVVGLPGQSEPYKIALTRLRPDGTLDPSFSNDGRRVVDPTAGDDRALDFSSTVDGRVVVLGKAGIRGYYLIRFTADGRLDQTFGDGGMTTGTFSGDYSGADVVVLPSGRIVVLAAVGATTFVRAHRVNGARDQSFGNRGQAILDGVSWEAVFHPSGRILVAGVRHDRRFVVDALREDGTRDRAFGVDGRGTIRIRTGPNDDLSYPRVAVLADGDIAIASDVFDENSFTTDLVLARLTAYGKPDSAFGGGDGWRHFNIGAIDVATAIAPLAGGGFVVSGFVGDDPFGDGGTTEMLLVALKANGELWRAFGDDGVVLTDLGARGKVTANAAVIVAGKLVVAGQAGGNMMVARFTL